MSKITGAMKYAGSVNTYADLPTTNRNPGDVYNVKTADTNHGIKAGENVAWNGTDWDPLGGTVDLSPYATNTSVAGAFMNVTYSNATLNFVKKDGSTVSATVNNVAHATTADSATSATSAAKATADANGNNIGNTYVKKTDIANAVTTATLSVTGAATAPTVNEGTEDNSVATTKFVANSAVNAVQLALSEVNKSYATKIEVSDLKSSAVAKTALWEALHSQDTTSMAGLTNAQWGALGLFMRYFTALGNFENQPSQYGQLLNLPADKGDEIMQLWLTQPDGTLYYRGGNRSKAVKDITFTRVANYNTDGHLVFPNGAELWVY